jgi:hypothetical protein
MPIFPGFALFDVCELLSGRCNYDLKSCPRNGHQDTLGEVFGFIGINLQLCAFLHAVANGASY